MGARRPTLLSLPRQWNTLNMVIKPFGEFQSGYQQEGCQDMVELSRVLSPVIALDCD